MLRFLCYEVPLTKMIFVYLQNSDLVSEAYFLIKDKEYNKALAIYKKINKRGFVDTNIISLTEDLRRRYESTKEMAFVFAEGYFKTLWLPGHGGLDLLRIFINQTDSLPVYKSLVSEAKAIVLKIKS